MKQKSPVSRALHEAFAVSLWPLLKMLGFELATPRNVKPGLVVVLATRALASPRRLDVTLWCDGTGHNLRFRADVADVIRGAECATQVALDVPWSEPGGLGPRRLDDAGNDFRPHEDVGQLQAAVAFLAGALAASVASLARALPELADLVCAASTEPAWIYARERAAQLWRDRFVRGEIDDRVVPARVVFVGANLVSLDAQGARVTFRFDTRQFDRDAAVRVSGWYLTPAGTRRPTRLTAGQRTWTFDPSGTLVGVAGE